jgi:hypothetical protein
MKVNNLIEFLEYSDRQASVVVGIVGADGQVHACNEILFLNHENRVYLIVDPADQSSEDSERKDWIRVADFERPQLFGQNCVLLPKPPR